MSEARIIDEIVTDVNQHTTAAVGSIDLSPVKLAVEKTNKFLQPSQNAKITIATVPLLDPINNGGRKVICKFVPPYDGFIRVGFQYNMTRNDTSYITVISPQLIAMNNYFYDLLYSCEVGTMIPKGTFGSNKSWFDMVAYMGARSEMGTFLVRRGVPILFCSTFIIYGNDSVTNFKICYDEVTL